MEFAKNVLISFARLDAQEIIQVCVLAVRPVLPSHGNQPLQPIGFSIPLQRLSATQALRSRSPSGMPGHGPESPTPCVPSYWPGRLLRHSLAAGPEFLSAKRSVSWRDTSRIARRGSTRCASTDRHAWRSIPISPCRPYRSGAALNPETTQTHVLT